MTTIRRTNSENEDFRKLARQSDEYPDETDKAAHCVCEPFDKIETIFAVNPQNYIFKDPLLLDFYEPKDNTKYRKSDIEQLIIDNLQKFLLESGRGFSFAARQRRNASADAKGDGCAVCRTNSCNKQVF